MATPIPAMTSLVLVIMIPTMTNGGGFGNPVNPPRHRGELRIYAPSSMEELHDLAEFDAHVERVHSLDGVVVQGVDLSERSRIIESVSCVGATFLGCRLVGDALEHVIDGGAAVFPRLPAIPFDPYRGHLYAQGELLTGWDPAVDDSFEEHALDSRIYRWSAGHPKGGTPPVLDALAQRLHDHTRSTMHSARTSPTEPTSWRSWADTRCSAPTTPMPSSPNWAGR